MQNKITWAFFGTSHLSLLVLEKMKEKGFLPDLIITAEDKPQGRKMILTPPEVKVWAEKEKIPFIQPKSLRKDETIVDTIKSYFQEGADVFVVASYGKIIPQNILDIPKFQTLNVHPSLLPKLRGASPIKSAILTENETGVTIMRLDAEMDHGPILAQKKVVLWNMDNLPYENDLQNLLANVGGEMLSEIFPKWIKGEIKEIEQDHNKATLCGKIEKEDGLLDLTDEPEKNLRKIRAFHMWPGAYFFIKRGDKNIRVIVKKAKIENGLLVIERVIPEGKNEMNYADFERGIKN